MLFFFYVKNDLFSRLLVVYENDNKNDLFVMIC